MRKKCLINTINCIWNKQSKTKINSQLQQKYLNHISLISVYIFISTQSSKYLPSCPMIHFLKQVLKNKETFEQHIQIFTKNKYIVNVQNLLLHLRGLSFRICNNSSNSVWRFGYRYNENSDRDLTGTLYHLHHFYCSFLINFKIPLGNVHYT